MLNAGCYPGVSVSPYLMSCPIPSSHANLTPVSVSLVEEMCETSTNYLNIIYNLPTGEKEKFAVCVKGLDFPMEDRSVRLVEWIEATMNFPPQIYYSYHDIRIRIDKICCILCFVGAGENLKVLFELFLLKIKKKTEDYSQMAEGSQGPGGGQGVPLQPGRSPQREESGGALHQQGRGGAPPPLSP